MFTAIVTALAPLIIAAVLFYSVSVQLRHAAHQRAVEAEARRDYLDDRDTDSDTLSRRRAQAAATIRAARESRDVRHVAFAAALVAESTRNRLIIAPALTAVTVLAFAVGGPLPGTLIAAVCALMAIIPLAAHSWLNSVADSAVSASGVTSDEPVYVPADWR